MSSGLPSPEQLARLSALSDEINGRGAPTPLADPVLEDAHGRVLLPVPQHDAPIVVDARMTSASRMQPRLAWADLHAGLTLQWAPIANRDGLLIAFRGGAPDGDQLRDQVATFLTRRGLRALIADLTAIESRLPRTEREDG